jgi:hypothetical protein
MPVLAVKTQATCKICKSPARADIDKLLEARSNREKDAAGNLINGEYVLRAMKDFGIVNPTNDNMKIHWSKHCQVVSEAVIEQATAAVADKIAALQEGAPHVDVDDNLRWLVSVGRAEIEARILEGRPSGVTVDHILKATAEMTRRHHNEATRDLLSLMGQGIAAALDRGPEKKELESGDVIEGEIVREELVVQAGG